MKQFNIFKACTDGARRSQMEPLRKDAQPLDDPRFAHRTLLDPLGTTLAAAAVAALKGHRPRLRHADHAVVHLLAQRLLLPVDARERGAHLKG